MIRMNTRINIQIKNIRIYEYSNIFVTLCNATHATSQYNNYHMTQRTHVPRCSCFDDDNSDSGTTDIQSTHGRPRFTLPATLPVTRIFFHYPTRTLPEVKNPYPSQPGHWSTTSTICIVQIFQKEIVTKFYEKLLGH